MLNSLAFAVGYNRCVYLGKYTPFQTKTEFDDKRPTGEMEDEGGRMAGMIRALFQRADSHRREREGTEAML